jgi:hypothetical protein
LKLHTFLCSSYPRMAEVYDERTSTDGGSTSPTRATITDHARCGALSTDPGDPGSSRREAHLRGRSVAPDQPPVGPLLDRVLRARPRSDSPGRPSRGEPSVPVDRGTPGRSPREPGATTGPVRLPSRRVDGPSPRRTPGTLCGAATVRDLDPTAAARLGLRLEAAAVRPGPRRRAR